MDIPRKGNSSSEDEQFDDEQLQAYLSSSIPNSFGLVGSLGALPGSLPRSLGEWPHAADILRAPALGDVESGRRFRFHGDESDEEAEDDEAEEVQGGVGGWLAEGTAAEAAVAALTTGHPDEPAQPSTPPAAAAAHYIVETAPEPAVSGSSGSPPEAIRILRLAMPLSVTNLAGYAISMVAIAAVGRLGEAALSVVVLATSVFNVTGLSVLIGFASALETFCGQAYGAGRYKLVGLSLQRALLLLTLVALLVAAIWTQAEPILLTLGQDAAIARGTGRFLLRATPALWLTAVFEALKRYLMAQEAVRPATVVTVIGLTLAPLYNWLLIFRLGLGLEGAAYAFDATQGTLAALLTAYTVGRDRLLSNSPLSTWHGFSAKAWSGWWQYCRFALPSVAMLCCEWSTFEVMVLMSGLLPDPSVSVSAMGLCIQTSGMAYMLVTGLACAASVRISNSLGAGQPEAARRATWTAWSLTMCLQTVVAVSIVLLRNSWPHIFTDSPTVVARTAELLPLFALSLFGDGTNAVLQGLLRGAGRQRLGAITNLLSYWCCGIPLAAYLAFKRDMGLQGLWWGLVIINTLQGCIMLTMAALFDFKAQAERAAVLLHQAAVHQEHEATNPLLDPLLPDGHAGGAANGGSACGTPTAAAAAAVGTAKGRRTHPRRSGAATRRSSAANEGMKQRLKAALLRLMTEGAHQHQHHHHQQQEQHRPAPAAGAGAACP